MSQAVSYNKTEFASTPSLGFMVGTHDNVSGSEAQLLKWTPGGGKKG